MPTPDGPRPTRLRAAGELVALGLAALAPWPYASAEPVWEGVLAAGVAVLVALWVADAVAARRVTFRPDLPAFALAGLILYCVLQLVPLPEGVVAVLSPRAAELHRTLVPAAAELLPGETVATPRPTWMPLSVDPYLTKRFVSQLVAVFFAYIVVRNWLASREAFRRLAWVAVANGAALAVLALSQFFSSPGNVVFWSVPTAGQVYGPFCCRNHYPDFLNICLGLGCGLAWRAKDRTHPDRQTSLPRLESRVAALFDLPGQILQSPRQVVLVALLGVAAASIPFSLSRGGILGTAVALVAAAAVVVKMAGRVTPGGGVLAGVVALAVGLVAALGWGPIEKQLTTAWSGKALDTRLPLWADAAKLIPQFPVFGAGGGTFLRIEPTVRTAPDPDVLYDNAHNEYLEAVVEGGPVRLALTLLLVFGVLRAGVVAAGKLRGRSTGPVALGAFFGLAALAAHSFTDFGVHNPAVAFLAAITAGHLAAAAADPGYDKPRVRKRKDGTVSPTPVSVEPIDSPVELRDGSAMFAGGVMVFVAAAAAWGLCANGRADLYRAAAAAPFAGTGDARVAAAAARVAWTPDDPEALAQLADAHFAAAAAAGRTATGAVAGGLGAGGGSPLIPPTAVAAHVYPGLAACRAARAAGPLHGPPHVQLGRYAAFFAKTEPAGVHFDRGKVVRPGDADLLTASGREALRRGDAAAARADWGRAMTLAPRVAPEVVKAAAGKLPLLDLLPPDPVAILAAADAAYPDAQANRAARRPLLEKLAAGFDIRTATVPALVAAATALDELGRPADGRAAWDRAIEKDPDSATTRDAYARRLEADEDYDAALVQLDWLRQNRPSDAVRDRIDAARHGARLKREIGGDGGP